jgi:hypothetical protein
MSRQRVNFQSGVVSGTITATQTTLSGFSGFTATIPSGSYVPVILNPGYYGSNTTSEIVWVTSVSAGTATVTRAQEGTTGITGTNLPWVSGPTVNDFGMTNMVTNGDVPGGSVPTGALGYSGTNVQTGNYTVVSGDFNNIIQLNNTSSIYLTIPLGLTTATGQQITAYRNNTGSVTIVPASGVTLVSTGATAAAPVIRAQYSVATAVNVGANSWLVAGDII